MAETSAAATNPYTKTGVRIVVAGEQGTGKSSLIMTAAAQNFPKIVPPVLEPTRLPQDFFSDGVPVTIIDTSSRVEDDYKVTEELKHADVVVFTYACNESTTLDRLSTFWLPKLRKLEGKVPVMVAGCKLDLRDDINVKQVMSPIMQQFGEIKSRIECSALKQFQIRDVFDHAQKAALHLVGPPFDLEAQTLRPRCRIPILCDHDRDGALRDAGLNYFPELPMDGVEFILSFLPAKVLVRFRSVSQMICSMLDSQFFIRYHLQKSIRMRSNRYIVLATRHELLYVHLDPIGYPIELPHPLMDLAPHRLEVIGSVDGILCICFWITKQEEKENTSISIRKKKRDERKKFSIIMWNWSINKYKILPNIYPICGPSGMVGMRLCYGFGYDLVNKDYKLVRLRAMDGKFRCKVKIYSMRANMWRKGESMPYMLCDKCNGIFVEGSLHWLMKVDEFTKVIIAFNLTDETCREISLPIAWSPKDGLSLGVLEGCLCLIHRNFSFGNIWMMKQYGINDTWVKLVELEEAQLIEAQLRKGRGPCSIILRIRPLCYSKTGDKVLLILNGWWLVWYDLLERSIQSVSGGLPGLFKAEIYIESLVRVDIEEDISETFKQLYED